jgi:putative transposase
MTSEAVSSRTKIKKTGRQLSPEQVAAAVMVAQAREQGLALTGPDGLLKLFTKSVLETALNEEMTEPVGYEKHGAGPDRESANTRNESRSKTVIWRRGG